MLAHTHTHMEQGKRGVSGRCAYLCKLSASVRVCMCVNVFSMCYHSPDLQVEPIHNVGLLLWQFCESIYERLAQFFNLLLSVNIKQQTAMATAFKDSVLPQRGNTNQDNGLQFEEEQQLLYT